MKLNSAQMLHIERIKSAKAVYDQSRDELERAYHQRLSDLKEPLRELVAKAKEAKVPVRQIHLAMGLAQVGQLLGFLKREDGGTAAALDALLNHTQAAVPAEVGEIEAIAAPKTGDYRILPTNHPQSLVIVTPDGTEKKLDVMIDGGLHAPRFSKYEWDEIPEGVKDALMSYYPTGPMIAMYDGGQIIWREQ